jgi:DNA repair exonuclease SbcCD nuclease subunit
MSYKVLFIGDPHFQVGNMVEVDLFMDRIFKLAKEIIPDLIVIAGDILHTHERLHTLVLNKAYEFVTAMREIAQTYILVGNHDMCNNQQFLTNNHWMNGMKEWNNVVIVDTVIIKTFMDKKIVFVPYVPSGRFKEALNTVSGWEDADCIFAHQEFYGCKMGAIVSIEGDKWSLDDPQVVSGHIHSKQTPQPNIYYSGSAMQHAFGESEKNIIALLTFSPDKIKYDLNEVDLALPRKKIVYMGVDGVDKYEVKTTQDQIKLTVNGNYDEFKALKKTKKYKEIINKGIKVVFKPTKISNDSKCEYKCEYKGEYKGQNGPNFEDILSAIITEEKNTYLMQIYELIMNEKQINEEDIIFL